MTFNTRERSPRLIKHTTDASDWPTIVSLVHSCLVLCVGVPVVAYTRLTVSHEDRWTITMVPCVWICAVSLLYFVGDCINVLLICKRNGMHRREFGMLFHHLVCVVGLSTPLLNGRDGQIVLLGLVLGETSNPPRLLFRLLRSAHARARRSHSSNSRGPLFDITRILPRPRDREDWLNSLTIAHVFMFIVCRLIAVHYCAHVVVRHGMSITQYTSVCVVVFSLCAFWEYGVSGKSARLGDVVL